MRNFKLSYWRFARFKNDSKCPEKWRYARTLWSQFTPNDLNDFDYILAMDHSNYRNILKLLKDQSHTEKVMLMREFDSVGKGEEVPDPYYGGEKNFQEVFEILDRSTENFINHLQKTILQRS